MSFETLCEEGQEYALWVTNGRPATQCLCCVVLRDCHKIPFMKKIKTLEELGILPSDRVLVVFAHPDDESVYAGGLIHVLARRDLLTTLTVLTKGEKSTLRNGLNENIPLAEIRAREFYHATDILGVKNRQIGAFHDGMLSQQVVELAEFLRTQISLHDPTVIVTLEPSGIYGHPDHIAASITVGDVAKEHNVKVLYVTVRGDLYDPSPASRRMAADGHIFEPLVPAFQLMLPEEVASVKLRAITAHASQHTINQEFIDKWGKQRQLLDSEFYTFS